MSFTDPQAQPGTGQDPQAPAAPAPAPVAPQPVGDGPWATDLNLLFQDPAVRTQVDGFLRQKVQPYITQQEQRVASSQDAVRLWDNLSQNPVDTYVAMTTEMFGEEAGQKLLSELQAVMNPSDNQAPQQQQAAPQQLDPRLQEAIDYFENQKNVGFYETELARLKGAKPHIDTDLIHPFVAAANGNFDQAGEMYDSWLATYGGKYGVTTNADTPAPTPPANVLGSDTATQQPSTTPVEPRKQSLGEAIEDFVRETRQGAAPPVGAM